MQLNLEKENCNVDKYINNLHTYNMSNEILKKLNYDYC